jgi:hypothetical protein
MEVFVATIAFGALFLILGGGKRRTRLLAGRKWVLIAAPTVLGLTLLVLWISGAFSTLEQRAQKLFDQGKYEEVLRWPTKYANLPIYKQAKGRVAEKMLAEGKYEEILAECADTPSAAEAMNKLAEKLVAEKKYDDALAKYPNTPAANMVRNAMAEQLYYSRKFDELVAKYPNTQAGMKARTEMAKVEFDKIMKMAKKARQAKLEEFLKNPNFARTESAMKAQEQLNRLTRKP